MEAKGKSLNFFKVNKQWSGRATTLHCTLILILLCKQNVCANSLSFCHISARDPRAEDFVTYFLGFFGTGSPFGSPKMSVSLLILEFLELDFFEFSFFLVTFFLVTLFFVFPFLDFFCFKDS